MCTVTCIGSPARGAVISFGNEVGDFAVELSRLPAVIFSDKAFRLSDSINTRPSPRPAFKSVDIRDSGPGAEKPLLVGNNGKASCTKWRNCDTVEAMLSTELWNMQCPHNSRPGRPR